MRYEIFVTLWGEKFVKKFLDFALSSQLTPGNLPGLSKEAYILYRIYTDRASEPFFWPGLERLSPHCDIEFIFYEDIRFKHGTLAEAMKHSVSKSVKHHAQQVTSQHHMALAADKAETAVVLMDSDFIFSDGSLLHLHEQRLAGKQAYAGMFLRLLEEEAGPKLLQRLPEPLSGRELVTLARDHMHPRFRSMFADAKEPSSYPTQINWHVGRKGFVTHCFFPHPLMVNVTPETLRYFSTMDYEVLLRAAPSDDDIYFCRNSEDMLVCKMSPGSYLSDMAVGPAPDLDIMARFAIANTNIRHQLFMTSSVRYVAEEDDAAFLDVEKRSEAFVDSIYKTAEVLLSRQATYDPKIMVSMKSFLGPIENFMSPQLHARMEDWLPK